jgi:hypothetical protein
MSDIFDSIPDPDGLAGDPAPQDLPFDADEPKGLPIDFDEPTESQFGQPAAAPYKPAAPAASPDKKKKTWIIIAVVVVVILCCCCALPLILSASLPADFIDDLMNEFSYLLPVLLI